MRGALAFVLDPRRNFPRVEPSAQFVDELLGGLKEGQIFGAWNRSGAKTSARAEGGPLDDGVPQALSGVNEKDGTLDF